MISIDEILIVAATLLLLGVVASKASSKLGVPALLLFLLIGMLAGSEGPGRIPFDNPRLAQSAGVVALAFILFAGGLDTDWSKVSSVLWRGLSLASLGVVITAVLVGWFATLLFRISWTEGLLLGSIVSSTDAAAVFSVLRSQNVSLKGTNSAAFGAGIRKQRPDGAVSDDRVDSPIGLAWRGAFVSALSVS